ncbi:MAG: DUF2779 domain-containing protein [Balneolaceae bacterium]|nr:DUF2779 domain-containing protein [Balneolaceae bacterium]
MASKPQGEAPLLRSFLFRTATRCPVRLRYHRLDYPEKEERRTYARHARYNRRQLEALLRAVHPGGLRVEKEGDAAAAGATREALDQGWELVYDAQFEDRGCRARLPLLRRREGSLECLLVQTRAFKPGRHRLSGKGGAVRDTWRETLLDFAFRMQVVSWCLPGEKLRPLLVFPSRSGRAANDALHRMLEEGDPLPHPESSLLVEVEAEEEVSRVRRGELFRGTSWAGLELPDAMESAVELLRGKRRPEPSPGYKCRGCEFRLDPDDGREPHGFRECWSGRMEEDDRHIFGLFGPGIRRWSREGIYLQHEIPEEEIATVAEVRAGERPLTAKQRQGLQMRGYRGGELPEEIVRPGLPDALASWRYPLYFLDFEAGTYAVPVRGGRPPYHLELFQFSCHTLHEDGSWSHRQWIDRGGEGYCNYALLRNLARVPGLGADSSTGGGTLVQYSGFEGQALRKMRGELREEQRGRAPEDRRELLDWLDALLDGAEGRPAVQLADMSRLVRDYYYNRHMEDSLGLKEVVRAVMAMGGVLQERWSRPYRGSNFDGIVWWQPDGKGGVRSPYRILVEQGGADVQRGAEAMTSYADLRAGRLGVDERQDRLSSLLKYCELDTLAMLMIFQHWNSGCAFQVQDS